MLWTFLAESNTLKFCIGKIEPGLFAAVDAFEEDALAVHGERRMLIFSAEMHRMTIMILAIVPVDASERVATGLFTMILDSTSSCTSSAMLKIYLHTQPWRSRTSR